MERKMSDNSKIARSLLRILLNFLIVMLLHDSFMMTEGLQKEPSLYKILEDIKSLPSSLLKIKKVPVPSFLKEFPQPRQLNKEYRLLNTYKQWNKTEKYRLMKLHKFADRFTRLKPNLLPNRVNLFIKNVIPRVKEFVKHVGTEDGRNKECERVHGQSLNYIVYNVFRFIVSVVRKGYSVILQSYIIRNAFEGVPDRVIDGYKSIYNATVEDIVRFFKNLAAITSTRIASCEPSKPLIGKTYLEMEKFLQGILPQEITLNKWNSGDSYCEDYKYQGTAYYPYEYIRHDDDWKCHGLMYECFSTAKQIEICKPSRPNRRLDGVIKDTCGVVHLYFREPGCYGKRKVEIMGHCNSKDIWELSDWRYSLPFSMYDLAQCACICDDFDHPRTLRKFSREYAMSDYKNNMVVTGVRLVNVSNVIHIQIQEGKLEEFGFINSSSVQWRLKNNIANHSISLDSRSSDEVVTLSYHKRRVNLDVFHFPPNDVVIGVAFDWTQEMDGVELTVFVTNFAFSTGKLNQDYRRTIAPNGRREEIVLEAPHVPELCNDNVPVEGDNKFIKFQTTDWRKDAAQTTIPYLDIQEVVTDPPAMLQGLGLYYKNRRDCGGYIGLELHSPHFDNLISSGYKILESPKAFRNSRRRPSILQTIGTSLGDAVQLDGTA